MTPEEQTDADKELEREWEEWAKQHPPDGPVDHSPDAVAKREKIVERLRAMKIRNPVTAIENALETPLENQTGAGNAAWPANDNEMPSQKQSNLRGVLVALAIALAVGWLGYHYYSQKSLEKTLEEKRLTNIAKAVAVLSSQFDATNSWEDKASAAKFSVGIEDAVKNTGHKAILINGTIDDVERKGPKCFLYVVNTMGSKEIGFFLECESGLAERVVKQNSGSEYAIVAQIDSVEKSAETESDGYVVRGRCLGLLLKEDQAP